MFTFFQIIFLLTPFLALLALEHAGGVAGLQMLEQLVHTGLRLPADRAGQLGQPANAAFLLPARQCKLGTVRVRSNYTFKYILHCILYIRAIKKICKYMYISLKIAIKWYVWVIQYNSLGSFWFAVYWIYNKFRISVNLYCGSVQDGPLETAKAYLLQARPLHHIIDNINWDRKI